MNETSKWIISDVHGCYKTLLALLDKLPEGAEPIFVGDLIDRGPDSRKIINLIKENNYTCVLGNHEDFMIETIEEFFENDNDKYILYYSNWFKNGGNAVIENYMIDEQLDVVALKDDIEWLKTLPIVYIDSTVEDEFGRNLLVSHSASLDGIELYLTNSNILESNIELTEEQQIDTEHTVSNLENIFLWKRKLPEKISKKFFNIFGHTPTGNFKEKKIVNCIKKDGVLIDKTIGYAAIDTGAIYKYHEEYGKLTAIEFPSLEIIQQENIDD